MHYCAVANSVVLDDLPRLALESRLRALTVEVEGPMCM